MDEQLRHYEHKLAFEIDSWDLKVALESKQEVVVVDARSPEAYQREHIPSAINIPHRTMTREATQHISRLATVVTYCDGIGCNASTKGALNMTTLGFRVKELIGGLEWWKRDGSSRWMSPDGSCSGAFATVLAGCLRFKCPLGGVANPVCHACVGTTIACLVVAIWVLAGGAA